MLEKLDFRFEEELYAPSDTMCILVEVPRFRFFSIKGRGNPNTSPDYQAGLEALYNASDALRFLLTEEGWDYAIGPLEGLWWTDELNDFLDATRENWKWRMMIRQPLMATEAQIEEALRRAGVEYLGEALAKLHCYEYEEGRAAQILHVGPYEAEAPTIEKLHRFLYEEGYQPRGKHHEIYLSDPRRVAPEELRTILRQPVEWHNPEG